MKTTLLPIVYKNFFVDEREGIIWLDVTFSNNYHDIAKGEYFDQVRLRPDGSLEFRRHSGRCWEGHAQELICPVFDPMKIEATV